MKKKHFNILLLFLSISLILTACSSKKTIRNTSKTLGINLSDGIISKSIDSHSGFHGDGITYVEIMFSEEEGDKVTEIIENNEGWRSLPLTNNLNTAVYGKKSLSGSTGPFVTDDDGNSLIPIVDNGYYFFIDRQEEGKEMKDDKKLLGGFSFNFTIAIYDTDSEILYYFELDT
ncbi:MAG: hypothetical protein ACTHW2_07710 [Tissierella sp.]|uniref:hypothetical protein n=1 Tax=Tissierella sp. TaxID=41274 RepID=UPI003F9AFDB4